MPKSKYRLIIAAIAALMAEVAYPSLVNVAHAAPQFTRAIVRWDTHKKLTDSGITACIVPSTAIVVPAGTDTSPYHIQLDFPHLSTGTNFSFNSTTASNWAVDTSFAGEGQINGLSMTAWTGIGSAADAVTAPVANTTGGTVKIPFGSAGGFTLATSSMYCFHITGVNTLHNSDAGTAPTMVEGSLKVYNNAGSPVLQYETLYNTSIIDDDTITVSAIVPPNFSLSKPNTTDSLGRLSTQQINLSSGVTFTITTNARSGWIAWVKDTDRGANPSGLFSATANYTIPTGPVGGAGTTVGDGNVEVLPTAGGANGYLLDADVTNDAAGGCTFPDHTGANGTNPGANVDYDANEATTGANTYSGGTLSKVFQPVAECTGAAPATANGDIVQLKEAVTIAGSTPAGTDYVDVLTLVAAGEF
jgi:hypothetical protein